MADLDQRSIALIKRQNPVAVERGNGAPAAQVSGVDGTRHSSQRIHVALKAVHVADERSGVAHNVEKLNEKVYASLFLTPNSDPWLGLFSADVYTALDNGGIVKVRNSDVIRTLFDPRHLIIPQCCSAYCFS